MTNETPLLDASHDAYVRLMAAARRSEPHNGYGEADIVSDELTLRSHIAELEAENKRLREALEELARLGGSNGEYGNSIGNQIAKAALAQPGEKS